MTSIAFNFDLIWDDILGDLGLSADTIHLLEPTAVNALEKLLNNTKTDELGFLNLPNSPKLNGVRDVHTYLSNVKNNYKHIVVLGIGGSSLGPLMLFKALVHPLYNINSTYRNGGPELFFLDSVDPETIENTLDHCDFESTLFIAISKSGTTLETLSQLSYILDKGKSLNLTVDIACITDPHDGLLREFALSQKCPIFTIPKNIGGRFSVLTPVGLLSSAFAGITISELLKGAADTIPILTTPEYSKNPALIAAMCIYHFAQQGRSILTLFPYVDSLESFADWCIQLIAESVGKEKDLLGNIVNYGITPIRALGPRDQHSQLQLFRDGPKDKQFIFIEVASKKNLPVNATLADAFPFLTEPSDFHSIRSAEKIATTQALAAAKHPSFTITLEDVNAQTIGKLIMFFEVLTSVLGYMANINPFDQPGVELGKKIAKGLLGDLSNKEYAENLITSEGRIELHL